MKVVKNIFMMFNGVQFTHLFLLHVMVMGLLIYGILIKISKHQLFTLVLLNKVQMPMVIKSKTMVKLWEQLSGQEMVED